MTTNDNDPPHDSGSSLPTDRHMARPATDTQAEFISCPSVRAQVPWIVSQPLPDLFVASSWLACATSDFCRPINLLHLAQMEQRPTRVSLAPLHATAH